MNGRQTKLTLSDKALAKLDEYAAFLGHSRSVALNQHLEGMDPLWEAREYHASMADAAETLRAEQIRSRQAERSVQNGTD